MRSNYSEFECIVIDDGSTDETPLVAKQFPVKWIRNSTSSGPAHARNLGANLAQGEILFFIDADVLIYPDTLSKIVNVFKNNSEIDALIGSYDDAPEIPGFFSQYKNLFHHFVHQSARTEAWTFWAACGAMYKNVFMAIGGFDEQYRHPSIEDIELGMRLKAHNKKIRLVKELQIKHLKQWNFWKLLKTDVFRRGVPWVKLLLKNRPFPNDLNIAFSQRVCVFLVYLCVPLLFFSFYQDSFWNYFGPSAAALGPAIIIINSRFYRFFYKKRGFMFALKVVPMHIIYYFCSGLSFLLGCWMYYKNQFTVSQNEVHGQLGESLPLRSLRVLQEGEGITL